MTLLLMQSQLNFQLAISSCWKKTGIQLSQKAGSADKQSVEVNQSSSKY